MAFGCDSIPAVLNRISHLEPDLTGVPEPLRGLLATCLAKRPEDRPSDGDILRMLTSGTVAKPPAGGLPPTVDIRNAATLEYTKRLEQNVPIGPPSEFAPPPAMRPHGPVVAPLAVSSTPGPAAKRTRALPWVLGAAAGLFAVVLGSMVISRWTGSQVDVATSPPLAATPTRTPSPQAAGMTARAEPSSTLESQTVDPTETPSPSAPEATPVAEPSAKPSPTAPAYRRVKLDRGIRLTLGEDWEQSGAEGWYCITPPFMVGDNAGRYCRLGSLQVTTGTDLWSGDGNGTPFDSLDDWGFGQATEDQQCLTHAEEFEPPKDAWKYDNIQYPKPKLLVHDSGRLGGFRSDHASWKIYCKYKSLIFDAWYVPEAKILFYVSGMTAKHRSQYEKILKSADFTEYLREPKVQEVG